MSESRGPGEWTFIGERDELSAARLRDIDPRYVFFLHWSWIVPAEIWQNFVCVVFHVTDLPYRRGGSPIQCLILRGYRETRLTAFRMSGELDAGACLHEKGAAFARLRAGDTPAGVRAGRGDDR